MRKAHTSREPSHTHRSLGQKPAAQFAVHQSSSTTAEMARQAIDGVGVGVGAGTGAGTGMGTGEGVGKE